MVCDYSNYLAQSVPGDSIQPPLPQVDMSQKTGFGTIPNFKNTAAASPAAAPSDDMWNFPSGMYATGNGAPQQLPSGGALVYGGPDNSNPKIHRRQEVETIARAILHCAGIESAYTLLHDNK